MLQTVLVMVFIKKCRAMNVKTTTNTVTLGKNAFRDFGTYPCLNSAGMQTPSGRCFVIGTTNLLKFIQKLTIKER